jgi:lysophospholipase L1-like esterase
MRAQMISAVGKMTRFVQKYNTNIIVVKIPHRYNLNRTLVVNSEMHAFNRQLLKVAKAYSHVTIVETDSDRKLFTQHGMHLNKRGMEWLSKLLATQISRLVIKLGMHQKLP